MPLEIPRTLEITLYPRTREERKVEVSIIDVRTMVTFPTLMTPTETLFITYQYGLLPIRVVTLPKVDATLEKVKEAIRLDIEAAPRREERFVIP